LHIKIDGILLNSIKHKLSASFSTFKLLKNEYLFKKINIPNQSAALGDSF